MEEKKYKFKLELDVATGVDFFPMRTLSFGYNTLKMLRQAAARKKERYFVIGERKYTQNDKGEYEPFAVFGTTIVPLSQLMAAAVRLQMEEEEKYHPDQPTNRRRVSKFPKHGNDELYSSFFERLKNYIHQNKNKK